MDEADDEKAAKAARFDYICFVRFEPLSEQEFLRVLDSEDDLIRMNAVRNPSMSLFLLNSVIECEDEEPQVRKAAIENEMMPSITLMRLAASSLGGDVPKVAEKVLLRRMERELRSL